MEKIIMGVVFGVAVTILAYEKYCKIKRKGSRESVSTKTSNID